MYVLVHPVDKTLATDFHGFAITTVHTNQAILALGLYEIAGFWAGLNSALLFQFKVGLPDGGNAHVELAAQTTQGGQAVTGPQSTVVNLCGNQIYDLKVKEFLRGFIYCKHMGFQTVNAICICIIYKNVYLLSSQMTVYSHCSD